VLAKQHIVCELCAYLSGHAYQQNCVPMPVYRWKISATKHQPHSRMKTSLRISGWKLANYSISVQSLLLFNCKIKEHDGASETFIGSVSEGYRTHTHTSYKPGTLSGRAIPWC